jgi:lipoprotein-anchoring transpeptidase ErfK/SrfK
MRRDPQPLLRLAAMKIRIDASKQELALVDAKRVVKRYSVSTAKKGLGEQNGSFCTPRGKHIVRAKIGQGLPLGAVFVRRRPTGEVWTPELHAKYPGRDWILTRILWLSGCEPGKNRLGEVDTMRRYIYIHGTPDGAAMGQPGSIGCIRMRNADIAELFELVPPYTPVEIR